MTTTVELEDIQGLLVSGYKHLPHARYTFLRIDDPERARAWLGSTLPSVTTAAEKQHHASMNLAFTWLGLERLGLDQSSLQSFPAAFRAPLVGPAADHRRRLLGDVGPNDPVHWKWGSGEPVHLLLMRFWSAPISAEGVDDTWPDRGMKVLHELPSSWLYGEDGTAREHFGFADGISQPLIEGTPAGRAYSVHRVKPGEFILGYEDETGSVPDSPRVPAAAGLPALAGEPRLADFGRNGSYLVARQLEQDVAGFWRDVAARTGTPPEHVDSQRLAAAIVGRWPDGTLMVEEPGGAPEVPDNEFGFVSRDPDGFGCPLGAHVRRVNPRDALEGRPADSWRAVNRHRLLRRGRPYGPPAESRTVPDGQERGLLFLGFNADLVRQFEFILAQWVNNPAFGRVDGECDPLLGARDPARTMTRQQRGVRQRLVNLPHVVTVKGSAYFFLPGRRALEYLARGGA
jgi:Dyp-type peroxidase family